MKTFDKPKVYLISKPQLNLDGINEFFKDYNLSWSQKGINTDGDLLPEFAGRICYVSFGKKQGRKSNESYLKNIIEMGHGSVLEHSNYTFLVTKASRGFTHEMVRHRAGFAYSQESTHYIDYAPETGLVNIPEEFNDRPEQKKMLEEAAKNSFKTYKTIYDGLMSDGINKKVACSVTRGILPIGIESKLVFTGNIRALRHFMQMRGNEHNVDEIRNVALGVYDIMKKEAPNATYDIKKVDFNGKEIIQSLYSKV